MSHILLAFVDELKNNGIELIESLENYKHSKYYTPDDFILIIGELGEKIQVYCLKFNNFPYSTDSEYYKIPSNLSVEKMISIIWLIFSNDYANKINHTNKIEQIEQINLFGNNIKLIAFQYCCAYLNIVFTTMDINDYEKMLESELLIKFNPNIQNIESIITAKKEKFDYFEIYYKL